MTTAGIDRPAEHVEGVEEPGHDPLVGVHVGGRDVAFGTEEAGDLIGVAAGHPFELAVGHLPGIAADATFAPAEGDVDDRRLEGHVGGQGRDLAGLEGGMETDAPLAGPREVSWWIRQPVKTST